MKPSTTVGGGAGGGGVVGGGHVICGELAVVLAVVRRVKLAVRRREPELARGKKGKFDGRKT